MARREARWMRESVAGAVVLVLGLVYDRVMEIELRRPWFQPSADGCAAYIQAMARGWRERREFKLKRRSATW